MIQPKTKARSSFEFPAPYLDSPVFLIIHKKLLKMSFWRRIFVYEIKSIIQRHPFITQSIVSISLSLKEFSRRKKNGKKPH
jgi:hypothetical protein